MRGLRVVGALGGVLRLFSAALLLPIPVALAYEPVDSSLFGVVEVPAMAIVFATAAALCTLAWLPMRLLGRRRAHEDLLDREAYLTVALAGLLVAAFAMLPFLLSRAVPRPVDALFEAMSGLTGTGITTIAPNVDLPPSLIWYRAFTQWLGGLGIIILTVALLSKLTHGGLQLLRTEASAHAATRIQPKIAEVAKGLWRMYGLITVVLVAVLTLVLHLRVGMTGHDAAFHGMVATFAAYGTGAFTDPGFAAVLADGWVRAILAFTMLLGATNFTLTFLLLRRGQAKPILRNPEWRFFLVALGVGAAALAFLLWRAGTPFGVALDGGAFTAVSMGTGTGIAHPAGLAFPHAATLVVILLVLLGGTAGSASGGLKAFRGFVLIRVVNREIRRILHPRAVIPVRVAGRVIPETGVSAVIAFFFTYLILWTCGAFLVAAMEPHLDLTAVSGTVLAALGNVGAGFGPLSDGVWDLHAGSKLVLTALMWFGRMELFAAILVFTPRSWRN
ncbi:MAG: trk/ktr system potassium uptake protein [Thermoplasmata archaeon]|jgi:trk system potassium uptake protein TrkH|nr:trk/ktr system potassium uptake protein [Thermoplasmata archaeon]